MINELLEVNQLLNGEKIDENNLQRICYMLARWYKEQGYDHLQIRKAIFEWANKYHVFLDFSVNSVVYSAMAMDTKLKGDVDVYVSDEDVSEIISRFDVYNTRMVALALLCYSKVYADKEGFFQLSDATIASWLGLNRGNVAARYMREAIDFGYIEKVKPKKASYTWNKTTRTKGSKLRLKVPTKNVGQYKLVNNDIARLYHEIFDRYTV